MMTLRPLSLSATLALALVSATPTLAWANDPVAEALYQEGRRAAQGHDWATACPKFRESYDREPAPGTLLNLGDCDEKLGKLVDAFAHFDAAQRLFPPGDERIAYANQRRDGVAKRLPKLTVRLVPTSPGGTAVDLDGAPVDHAALGTATPLDPGEHTLVVHAPGCVDVRTTLRLAEGEAREIELAAGMPVASLRAPTGAVAATMSPPQATPDDAGTRSSMRAGSWVSFGIAGVGLGLGIVGGIVTLNAKSAANASCTATCGTTGLAAESRGKTWSAVSTTGFIVAGVGVAAGVTLILVSPHRSSTSALVVRPTTNGASVGWVASF
jgi:hypothetical protein